MKFIKISTLIFVLLSIPYYKTVVFDFEEGTPFKGDQFYNPYENISSIWLKANFHAHTKLYFGLTNGKNTPEEMYERYDSIGYDFPGISNYNRILPNNYNRNLYITAYEHGRNFGFVHQLSINAKQVINYDYPFFQFLSHKQSVINKQKTNSELIALTHPSFKNGYTKKELHNLNNYDLFEGMTPRAGSIELWDEALSYGHAVWVMGGDDAHEKGIDFTGVCWSMVNVNDTTESGILNSLKTGAFYATRGWNGQEMHRIQKVSVDSGFYHLVLNSQADSIILKGDFGKTLVTVANSNRISYQILPENSYIRAEIFDTEPWNNYTKTYLNPVIRTENGIWVKHNNNVIPNPIKTWLVRVLLLVIQLSLLVFIFKRKSPL